MKETARSDRLGGRAPERIVIGTDELAARVRVLGAEISDSYQASDHLLVLGILKGSFIFMADLVRAIRTPLQVDFLAVSSYGDATRSSGTVRLLYDPVPSLEGRAVLVVEDILDSGTTLQWLIPRLEARGASSVDICTLLHKRVASSTIEPRWIGFDAPNSFLVGYGLDHAEDFRHLPYIASL